MPVYCFSSDSGDVVERFFTMKSCPRAITVGNKVYRKDIGATLRRERPQSGNIYRDFNAGDALGVLPRQREEAIRHSQKIGVPTHFDEHGDPHFTSRGHYNKYVKARGKHMRSAGWNDVSPS